MRGWGMGGHLHGLLSKKGWGEVRGVTIFKFDCF